MRRVRARGHGRTCTPGVITGSRLNWLDPMGPRFGDWKANVNPVVVHERQSIAAATTDESPHTAAMSLLMLETLPNQRRIWNVSQRALSRSAAALASNAGSGRFDSLWAGLRWTLVDERPVIAVSFELENELRGLLWTLYRRHCVQKVRGSNHPRVHHHNIWYPSRPVAELVQASSSRAARFPT